MHALWILVYFIFCFHFLLFTSSLYVLSPYDAKYKLVLAG